jgi:Na+/serine symporter
MKPIYRFTYLLLVLIGCILFVALIFADPFIWALTGKSPACRFLDRYSDWMESWKKRKGI